MTAGPPEIKPDTRAARAEGIVQIVIMLAIGGAAGAASFTHVHDVAAAHGQGGWLPTAYGRRCLNIDPTVWSDWVL